MDEIFIKLRKNNYHKGYLPKTYQFNLFDSQWFYHTKQGLNYEVSLDNILNKGKTEEIIKKKYTQKNQQKLEDISPKRPISRIEKKEDPVDFLKDLEKCQKCNNMRFREDFVVHCEKSYTEKQKVNILFILDFPSKGHEDQNNMLEGTKGRLLERMINAMELNDQSFHVTHFFKCASKDGAWNKQMVDNCLDYLHQEIEYLKPEMIITFGANVTNHLLKKKERLSVIHGQFFKIKTLISKNEYECLMMPLFHLDYLLINPKMKKTAWLDLQKVIKFFRKN